MLGIQTRRLGDGKGFRRCRSRLPTEGRKEPDGGLFDELVFGVVVGFHRAGLRPQRRGLMCSLSVNRFGVFECLCIRKCFF